MIIHHIKLGSIGTIAKESMEIEDALIHHDAKGGLNSRTIDRHETFGDIVPSEIDDKIIASCLAIDQRKFRALPTTKDESEHDSKSKDEYDINAGEDTNNNRSKQLKINHAINSPKTEKKQKRTVFVAIKVKRLSHIDSVDETVKYTQKSIATLY